MIGRTLRVRKYVSHACASSAKRILQSTREAPSCGSNPQPEASRIGSGTDYSTVTDFARLRGWSTLRPRFAAM
jgi:hypothetical protein